MSCIAAAISFGSRAASSGGALPKKRTLTSLSSALTTLLLQPERLERDAADHLHHELVDHGVASR